MNVYKYIERSFFLLLAICACQSCSNEEMSFADSGNEHTVVFRPVIKQDMNSRAIGDATGIDQLTVTVYEGTDNLTKRFSVTENWSDAKQNGIKLTLIEGRSYKILFWAEDEGNSAYTLTDDGKITVNYNDYINGGFARMEEMDAFCGTSSITVGSEKNENKSIELSRPLAQLNFADNATQPEQGTHQTVVTFHGIPTSLNPFTGTVEMSDTDVAFTFTDFPSETLSVDGSTYYYLSSNYLFAPQTGTINNMSATIDLQNTDGTSIKEIEVSSITLEKNKKTNVTGSIVQQPEIWSVWNGESKTQPDTDDQNRYIIDDASDIAWLCENSESLNANSVFLQTKNIDMSNTTESIILPTGSTYDGGGKTIKNFANSLFGDATTLTVKDLSVENITASGSTHIGTLVNTLKGSSSFTNVSVKSSSVTTINGAAGGIVGYIVRTSEKDCTESLNVSFSSCKLNNVSVSGSESEGKFVGLLSGYDNNENLTFDAACEATDVAVADYASVYIKSNNSDWAGDVTTKYDGWLGHETYRRAKVTFGGVRLAPRWDGTIDATVKSNLIKIDNDDSKYEVHSPFDLAAIRDTYSSLTTLNLMENVDMYGQGVDGKYNVPSTWSQSTCVSEDDNYFKSFSSIVNLDGNNYGIYNLNINTQKVSTSLYYGGFIQSTSGTTTHQNIDFHNCCIVVPLVVYKNEDKGSAGVLVSNIAGDSYTMNNVHTYDCQVFALQKVGGLAARVAATRSTITNCSVNDCYIENYECKGNLEKFSKSMTLLGNSVTVSASFYSYGEVGGMFGFVENNAEIINCHVNRTEIYAFGQDDANADIKGSGFLGYIGAGLVQSGGYFVVPGRHVGTFIGDICTSTTEGETTADNITMINCTVDDETTCTNDSHFHNNICGIVGLAYYVFMKDEQGIVKFDNTELILMNCNRKQVRDQ